MASGGLWACLSIIFFFFCGGGEGERAWGSGTDADLRVYCQLCGLLLPTRHLASALHLLRIIKKPPKWPQVHFRPGRRPLGAFHSNLSLTLAILSPVTPGWGTRSRDLVQGESISWLSWLFCVCGWPSFFFRFDLPTYPYFHPRGLLAFPWASPSWWIFSLPSSSVQIQSIF